MIRPANTMQPHMAKASAYPLRLYTACPHWANADDGCVALNRKSGSKVTWQGGMTAVPVEWLYLAVVGLSR